MKQIGVQQWLVMTSAGRSTDISMTNFKNGLKHDCLTLTRSSDCVHGSYEVGLCDIIVTMIIVVIRLSDGGQKVFCLPLNFLAIHTLFSETADRRPVKSTSVVGSYMCCTKKRPRDFAHPSPNSYRGSKSSICGLGFRPSCV